MRDEEVLVDEFRQVGRDEAAQFPIRVHGLVARSGFVIRQGLRVRLQDIQFVGDLYDREEAQKQETQ